MRNPSLSLVDEVIIRNAPTCAVSDGWEKDMRCITIQYLATPVNIKLSPDKYGDLHLYIHYYVFGLWCDDAVLDLRIQQLWW